MTKNNLHFVAANPKILESTAEGQNVTLFVPAFPLGGQTGNDPVCGQEVQNAQAFDDRGDLRGISVFTDLASRDMGMSRFEGRQARDVEVVNPCVCMAADGRQGYRG